MAKNDAFVSKYVEGNLVSVQNFSVSNKSVLTKVWGTTTLLERQIGNTLFVPLHMTNAVGILDFAGFTGGWRKLEFHFYFFGSSLH